MMRQAQRSSKHSVRERLEHTIVGRLYMFCSLMSMLKPPHCAFMMIANECAKFPIQIVPLECFGYICFTGEHNP